MILIDVLDDVIPSVPPISSEGPSIITTRDANIVTSNSWADLADVEEDIPKQIKGPRAGRSNQKPLWLPALEEVMFSILLYDYFILEY